MYNLPDGLTERLFSACPVLEELSVVGLLINADVVINFNISSPTLKKLGIRFDVGDRLSSYNEHKILIRAPNLERLHIIDYALISYIVHELHSLTEVFIDVSFVEGPLTQAKRVLELLEGVNEIKFMSLSAETMYALDWAYEDFFPTFPNLIYLNVEIRGTSRKLLLAILNSLPNLEVFVIHNHRLHDFGYIFDEPVPLCLLLHVKKIEMRNFKGYEHQFQLVKYFLKNSVSLEKAVVESQEMATQEKLKQCQELLMLERASKFCQVEFL